MPPLPDSVYLSAMPGPGHPWHSAQLELIWLPCVGPTVAWLYRALNRRLDDLDSPRRVSMDSLARQIGGINPRAFKRTLDRGEQFGLWRLLPGDLLQVSRTLAEEGPVRARKQTAEVTSWAC
jgi:hypothetical protein